MTRDVQQPPPPDEPSAETAHGPARRRCACCNVSIPACWASYMCWVCAAEESSPWPRVKYDEAMAQVAALTKENERLLDFNTGDVECFQRMEREHDEMRVKLQASEERIKVLEAALRSALKVTWGFGRTETWPHLEDYYCDCPLCAAREILSPRGSRR